MITPFRFLVPTGYRIPFVLAALMLMWRLPVSAETETPEAMRSPVNQVFQFAQSGECTAWPDGSKSKGTAYLWIPENCKKLRGLVIMCTNVPEHMLVGHPAIRRACEANDLGILWCVPTFWNFAKIAKGHDNIQVDFLQQLLDGLAAQSGYAEISTVPWLPIGESGHLLMVVGLVNERPERCMAAICVKNPEYPKDKSVPMLWTVGTAYEWSQAKGDIRTSWNSADTSYTGWIRERAADNWPLSLAIEAGSGHFYCSDAMAELFGKYIDAAAKARLSDDGSATLKPVKLENGFLAHLPLPGHEGQPITAYSDPTSTDLERPWFFDQATAKAAQEISTANWKAETQMPGIVDGTNCTIQPYSLNSVNVATVSTDSDFSLNTVMLDKIPDGFVGAGEKLAQSPGIPTVEWTCGPVAPLGNNKFRVALDRTWKSGGACYLILRKDGTDTIRLSVQPLGIKLLENTEGAAQLIDFPQIPDVASGTESIPLVATSDAKLPVSFFVVSGPAIVTDGKLVFTKIPPRTRFPVSVTVAAWQWGQHTDPKVKMAPIVRQTFHILAP